MTEEKALSPLETHYIRLQDTLEKSRTAMAEILPAGHTVDRFIRQALVLWRTKPEIQKCTPQSVAAAAVEAAALHLSLDPHLGQAYLIPRGKKIDDAWCDVATLMIGYPGLVKLARESGQVFDFTAQLVYEHDRFEFSIGTDKRLTHSWDLTTPRVKMIGGYLYVKLTSGEQHIWLMTAPQLYAAKERILAANGITVKVDDDGIETAWKTDRWGKSYETNSPWVSDPEPMFVKTLIRRGSKTLPLGDVYTRAVAIDEAGDMDNPQGFHDLSAATPRPAGDVSAQAATEKTAADLAAKIRAASRKPAELPKAEPEPKPEPEPEAPAQDAQEPAQGPEPEQPPLTPASAPAGIVEPLVGPPSGVTEEEIEEMERNGDPGVDALKKRLAATKKRTGRKPQNGQDEIPF